MKEGAQVNRMLKDILLIILGSLIFAIGVNYFAIPNRLSEGGVIGVTIVTYYLFDWSPGIVNFIINTILLAMGYKLFSKRVTAYTMVSIILDRKSTRLNSSHVAISYAVFCLKKK